MADSNKNPSNFLNKGVHYSITINLDDKHQYFGIDDRDKKAHSFMYEQLLHFKSIGITHELYMELSEPKSNSISKNGPRLHFHGTIMFHSCKSVKRFLLIEWYKLSRFSNFDIDTINDMDKWVLYCKKQQSIIKMSPLSNHIK